MKTIKLKYFLFKVPSKCYYSNCLFYKNNKFHYQHNTDGNNIFMFYINSPREYFDIIKYIGNKQITL